MKDLEVVVRMRFRSDACGRQARIWVTWNANPTFHVREQTIPPVRTVAERTNRSRGGELSAWIRAGRSAAGLQWVVPGCSVLGYRPRGNINKPFWFSLRVQLHTFSPNPTTLSLQVLVDQKTHFLGRPTASTYTTTNWRGPIHGYGANPVRF